MVDPERQRAIVYRPKVALDGSQRTQYTEAIMPFVLAAREVYKPILEVREQAKFLDNEQKRIEEQIENTPGTDRRHPLSAALTGIKLSRAELQHSPELPIAREEFRLRANELIAEVNKWRARFAVSANLVNPGAIALIGQPQIPPIEKRNKFKRPESPIRPHNVLGTLSIYRGKKIRPDLAKAISTYSNTTDATEVSLALVHLVPSHIVAMDRSAPYELRNSDALAKHIVEVSQIVGMYDAGLLQPPSSEELGLQSAEQNEHIATHLRSLLAHFLRDELANPNRTEKQLQDFYQDLSNYVRRVARHITPKFGHVSDSYERLGLIIEKLQEGYLIASRLSTNLFQDLGLPCLDYMGETRLAEVMRNIASSGHWSSGNRGGMTIGGYEVPEAYRILLGKVIESISERLGRNEINCQRLFEAIESLDYGDQVIENLFGIADDDQWSFLWRALAESNCFTDVIKVLRSKGYDIDYDLDE